MRPLLPLLLAAVFASCATAPAPAAAPSPSIEWPEEGPVRARALRALDGRAAEPSGFWLRLWTAFIGEERPRRPAPPLIRPFGVAAGAAQLYVTDPDAGRVLAIDPQTGTGRPLACERGWGAPMAVLVTAEGAVLVTDGARGRVLRWEKGRCTEVARGPLVRPVGLAVAHGRLYVVDPPRHRVTVFGPGGEAPFEFGGHGDHAGALNFPTAIAAAPDGTLWVVDALNFRLAQFDPDGRPLRSFGARGDQGAALARPKAVAIDGEGRLFVTDAQRDQVLVFEGDGTFAFAFGAAPGTAGLALPAGISLAGPEVYVADAFHHQVRVYGLLEVSR